jgi:hypothetical protein
VHVYIGEKKYPKRAKLLVVYKFLPR